MKRILVVGNALVDRLYQNTPDETLSVLGLKRGSMTLIDDNQAAALAKRLDGQPCERATGGSAANAAKAMAHLGTHVSFIGCVGCDEVGEFFAQTLENAGVHSCVLTDSAHSTGIATTFISPDGERTFATHLGAANTMDTDLISTELIEGRDLLYLEGYLVQNHNLVMTILRIADRLGMEIALDMASYNIVAEDRDFFRQILADYVDIVFANEQEALAFAFPGRDVNQADDEAVEMAATMLSRICRIAVVKCGAKGSIYHEADVRGYCPAHEVPREKVIDTTAAGDFFAAGFLSEYAKGMPIAACMEKGAEVSAEIIQVVGSRLPHDTWERLR